MNLHPRHFMYAGIVTVILTAAAGFSFFYFAHAQQPEVTGTTLLSEYFLPIQGRGPVEEGKTIIAGVECYDVNGTSCVGNEIVPETGDGPAFSTASAIKNATGLRLENPVATLPIVKYKINISDPAFYQLRLSAANADDSLSSLTRDQYSLIQSLVATAYPTITDPTDRELAFRELRFRVSLVLDGVSGEVNPSLSRILKIKDAKEFSLASIDLGTLQPGLYTLGLEFINDISVPYTDPDADAVQHALVGDHSHINDVCDATHPCQDFTTCLANPDTTSPNLNICQLPNVDGGDVNGIGTLDKTPVINQLVISKTAATNDVVGVRVYTNPDNISAQDWYQRKLAQPGIPVPIVLDGYNGVTDERTAYINAANVSANGAFYTNVYVIAYNTNASPAAINIYGQLLNNWKFNQNLIRDLNDVEGNKVKNQLRRDTSRLEQINVIRESLERYHNRNQKYPDLNAGTFAPGHVLSTWPSWQSVLGSALGTSLPVDPINKLAKESAAYGSAYTEPPRQLDCTNNYEKADCQIICTRNAANDPLTGCKTGQQCVGGEYCSIIPAGFDAVTGWNQTTQKLAFTELSAASPLGFGSTTAGTGLYIEGSFNTYGAIADADTPTPTIPGSKYKDDALVYQYTAVSGGDSYVLNYRLEFSGQCNVRDAKGVCSSFSLGRCAPGQCYIENRDLCVDSGSGITTMATPIIAYNFSETSGNIIHDQIGTTDATTNFTSSAPLNPAHTATGITPKGQPYRAVKLSTTEDITTSVNTALTTLNEFTVTAFVKPASLPTVTGSNPTILSMTGQNPYIGLDYVSGSPDYVRFMYRFSGVTIYTPATFKVQVDTWYHIVGTYKQNSATPTYEFSLFINGVQVGSPLSTTVQMTARNTWRMGGSGFSGQFDSFAVYNRALNGIEIDTLYQSEASAFNVAEDTAVTPLFSYDFNETTGSTIIDKSGNGRNGTFNTTIESVLGSGTYSIAGTKPDGTEFRALKFNGSADANTGNTVTISGDTKLGRLDGITYTADVRIDAWPNNTKFGMIVSRGASYPYLAIQSTSSAPTRTILVNIDNTGTGIVRSAEQSAITVPVWHKLHAIIQKVTPTTCTSGSQTLTRLYMDGDEINPLNPIISCSTTLVSADTNLIIGGNYSGGYHFNGLIDNLAVYNGAFTPTQLAKLAPRASAIAESARNLYCFAGSVVNSCGNGIVQTDSGEQCEPLQPGTNSNFCDDRYGSQGWYNETSINPGCTSSCQLVTEAEAGQLPVPYNPQSPTLSCGGYCGDLTIQFKSQEQCDEGDTGGQILLPSRGGSGGISSDAQYMCNGTSASAEASCVTAADCPADSDCTASLCVPKLSALNATIATGSNVSASRDVNPSLSYNLTFTNTQAVNGILQVTIQEYDRLGALTGTIQKDLESTNTSDPNKTISFVTRSTDQKVTVTMAAKVSGAVITNTLLKSVKGCTSYGGWCGDGQVQTSYGEMCDIQSYRTPSPALSVNQLDNPGFENELTGWKAVGADGKPVDTASFQGNQLIVQTAGGSNVKTGSSAIIFQPNNFIIGLAQQVFYAPITGSTTLNFSVWAKRIAGADTPTLRARIYQYDFDRNIILPFTFSTGGVTYANPSPCTALAQTGQPGTYVPANDCLEVELKNSAQVSDITDTYQNFSHTVALTIPAAVSPNLNTVTLAEIVVVGGLSKTIYLDDFAIVSNYRPQYQCGQVGSQSCQLKGGYCGDHIVQAQFGEQCDDGAAGSETCSKICAFPFCGDGKKNQMQSNQSYSVSVLPAPNTAKAITIFRFDDPTILATGAINEDAHTIAVTVPNYVSAGTIAALTPTIGYTGASVVAYSTVESTTPLSGPPYNFTSPIIFRVTPGTLLLQNPTGSVQNYSVTVTKAPNTAKAITSFKLAKPSTPAALLAIGVVNESNKTISVTVPYDTDLVSLIPTIGYTGASISPASGARDLTAPRIYTVTAGDSSIQNYTVTVTKAPRTAQAITSFSFTTPPAVGVINEYAKTISVTVPNGYILSANLTPTIVHTGISLSPASGVARSFTTSPVNYLVTPLEGLKAEFCDYSDPNDPQAQFCQTDCRTKKLGGSCNIDESNCSAGSTCAKRGALSEAICTLTPGQKGCTNDFHCLNGFYCEQITGECLPQINLYLKYHLDPKGFPKETIITKANASGGLFCPYIVNPQQSGTPLAKDGCTGLEFGTLDKPINDLRNHDEAVSMCTNGFVLPAAKQLFSLTSAVLYEDLEDGSSSYTPNDKLWTCALNGRVSSFGGEDKCLEETSGEGYVYWTDTPYQAGGKVCSIDKTISCTVNAAGVDSCPANAGSCGWAQYYAVNFKTGSLEVYPKEVKMRSRCLSNTKCGNGVIERNEQCEFDSTGVERAPSAQCTGRGFDGGKVHCDPISCKFRYDNCIAYTRPSTGQSCTDVCLRVANEFKVKTCSNDPHRSCVTAANCPILDRLAADPICNPYTFGARSYGLNLDDKLTTYDANGVVINQGNYPSRKQSDLIAYLDDPVAAGYRMLTGDDNVQTAVCTAAGQVLASTIDVNPDPNVTVPLNPLNTGWPAATGSCPVGGFASLQTPTTFCTCEVPDPSIAEAASDVPFVEDVAVSMMAEESLNDGEYLYGIIADNTCGQAEYDAAIAGGSNATVAAAAKQDVCDDAFANLVADCQAGSIFPARQQECFDNVNKLADAKVKLAEVASKLVVAYNESGPSFAQRVLNVFRKLFGFADSASAAVGPSEVIAVGEEMTAAQDTYAVAREWVMLVPFKITSLENCGVPATTATWLTDCQVPAGTLAAGWPLSDSRTTTVTRPADEQQKVKLWLLGRVNSVNAKIQTQVLIGKIALIATVPPGPITDQLLVVKAQNATFAADGFSGVTELKAFLSADNSSLNYIPNTTFNDRTFVSTDVTKYSTQLKNLETTLHTKQVYFLCTPIGVGVTDVTWTTPGLPGNKYIAVYNGSAWVPVSMSTTFSTSTSPANQCNYQCLANYHQETPSTVNGCVTSICGGTSPLDDGTTKQNAVNTSGPAKNWSYIIDASATLNACEWSCHDINYEKFGDSSCRGVKTFAKDFGPYGQGYPWNACPAEVGLCRYDAIIAMYNYCVNQGYSVLSNMRYATTNTGSQFFNILYATYYFSKVDQIECATKIACYSTTIDPSLENYIAGQSYLTEGIFESNNWRIIGNSIDRSPQACEITCNNDQGYYAKFATWPSNNHECTQDVAVIDNPIVRATTWTGGSNDVPLSNDYSSVSQYCNGRTYIENRNVYYYSGGLLLEEGVSSSVGEWRYDASYGSNRWQIEDGGWNNDPPSATKIYCYK